MAMKAMVGLHEEDCTSKNRRNGYLTPMVPITQFQLPAVLIFPVLVQIGNQHQSVRQAKNGMMRKIQMRPKSAAWGDFMHAAMGQFGIGDEFFDA